MRTPKSSVGAETGGRIAEVIGADLRCRTSRVLLFGAKEVSTVTIEEAQAKLSDLIHTLAPGDEVLITENSQPVARLVSERPKPSPGLRPPPGLGKGCITIIADDDEHLKDFAEYMS